MSNKNLLKEGTIRRFMKLAEIDSLANPFVDRINEGEEEIYEAEEDELAGMEGDASAEEAGLGDEPEMDMGDEPDMDMDMGMGDEEDMEGEDDPMAEISAAIGDAVSELLQGMVDDGTLEISQGEDTDEVDLEAEPEGGEEMEMADIEVSDEEPETELAESDVTGKSWSKEYTECRASAKGRTVCDQEEAARQAGQNESHDFLLPVKVRLYGRCTRDLRQS